MNTFLMVLLFTFASKYGRSFQHYSIRKNVKATTFMTFRRSKFADPKNDLVFKKLFIDSSVVVDFLNKVLPTKHIKNVEYIPTNMDPDVRTKRQSIIDVLCTDENSSKYIVEMDFAQKWDFHERDTLYYATKTYGSQLNKGGQYSDLLEVIFITITDFIMFPKNTKYFSTSTIRDTKFDEHTLKNFTFIFIEVPKYKEYENAEGIDEWIDLFKTASSRKKFQTSNPMIKKAYEMLEFHGWTDQELYDYEYYEKILLDYQVTIDQIYDEGKTAGIAEGIDACKTEGKAEAPKNKEYENAEGIDERNDLLSRKKFQTSNPMIKKAYEMLEFKNWTEKQLSDYQISQKIQLDKQARFDRIYAAGKAEGIAEGIATGKAEAKATIAKCMLIENYDPEVVEIAKTMLRKNYDIDTISKMTGISHDEIRRLGLED